MLQVREELLDDKTRRLRSLRMAKEAEEGIVRAREAHRQSAAGFWDNIDTSAGPGTCHLWTGPTRWSHEEGVKNRIEYGIFYYEGCDSYHASRVACFATYGREVPKDRHLSPVCGNYLCCNLDHLYVTKPGQNREAKIREGISVRKFFCAAATD